MADTFSKDKRSQIMSKISGKETKPEIKVRKYLFSKGFRYRKNNKNLPGKPDITLPKYKTVIFVHGCFWHNHEGCKAAALPQANREFWENKLRGNAARDRAVQEKLRNAGWRVIVVWQCQIKNRELFEQTMSNVVRAMVSK